jgi:hypothetical protein
MQNGDGPKASPAVWEPRWIYRRMRQGSRSEPARLVQNYFMEHREVSGRFVFSAEYRARSLRQAANRHAFCDDDHGNVVTHDKTRGLFLNGPRRREAARYRLRLPGLVGAFFILPPADRQMQTT